MKYFSRIFAPTNNRRLNELIGFLLCVSALLLFLALASYSPLDPSLNSASVLTGSRAARNWIGLVGAVFADLLLQCFGIGAFLLDRKSTRLNSSHPSTSYAVFCLKKKKNLHHTIYSR